MKKLSERSIKSKEKFADSNMAVANSIASAVFIGILVLPLTAFISAIILGNTPFQSIKTPDYWYVLLFSILYISPLFLSWYAKDFAMDLYDEVDSFTTQTEQTNNDTPHLISQITIINQQTETPTV
ncbi:MAG: hypothetical protein ABW170_06335 [Candidatus Thiodiazotropha sp. L084R]